MRQRSRQTVRRAVLFSTALLAGFAICGCSHLSLKKEPEVVFPRLDTARAQFYYAARYDENTLVGGSREERNRRLRRIIAAYQTVLDNFPDDQFYTPLALASIANCYFRMGDYREAIKIFEEAKKRYPNYPFIHAQAEYKIAQSLDRLGKTAEAKRRFKRCIDTFRHSENDQIRAIVAMCEQLYLRPTVPERTKPRRLGR